MREKALTIPELCEVLGLNEWAVRKRIKDKTIPAFQVGRVWRASPEALRRKFGEHLIPRPEPASQEPARSEWKRRRSQRAANGNGDAA